VFPDDPVHAASVAAAVGMVYGYAYTTIWRAVRRILR
jgi:hypothetical protein